jgi:hypothetical protein
MNEDKTAWIKKIQMELKEIYEAVEAFHAGISLAEMNLCEIVGGHIWIEQEPGEMFSETYYECSMCESVMTGPPPEEKHTNECEYCKRERFVSCRNTRDMEESSLSGDKECFYQLAKCGGGEYGLKSIIIRREKRVKRQES